MKISFNPATVLEDAVIAAAESLPEFEESFDPIMRPADPRFGDYQANGVLPLAKQRKINPRELATRLANALNDTGLLDDRLVSWEISGPGFINFTLTPEFYLEWLQVFHDENALQDGAGNKLSGKTVIVDFSSPNTAKEMHVGHIRSTVIGEATSRILEFCGANVIRDNHIGDWGTQFGMIIWAIKHFNYDLDAEHENPLVDLENLYKEGHAAYKQGGEIGDQVRAELVKLQQGDPENTRIWQKITRVSWNAFQNIYKQLGIEFDEVLGESFYRDKVDRIYEELTKHQLAEESEGALVVFHPEHKRFAKQPLIIRKTDGASNYATTDLATILYRKEKYDPDWIIYVVDSRQSDHFEQVFLTTKKWFEKSGRSVPLLQHISFGNVLGLDGKPIKTKEGGSVKLKDLMKEAVERSYAIVSEKNPDLDESERRDIAEAVGLGAIRYVDLSQNRTSDYIFSWERMLSFEGNTAPYLLYAVARIHSIFRKAGFKPGDAEDNPTPYETEEEKALARKLVSFTNALDLAISDLRPHLLCNYLYELAGHFSSFYNANKVIGEDQQVMARRIILCARTLRVLETGLHLLGLRTLQRM